MGPDPGRSEEVRGDARGRAVGQRRLIRLVVIGVIAIVAAVLLIPQIRELADDGDGAGESGIPEGIDVFRAASNGDDVYGVGGVLDGQTFDASVFAFRDGAWEPASTPEDAEVFGDVAIADDRIAVIGSTANGRASVWTATIPNLEWERELPRTEVADLRAIAMTETTVVAVGSLLDETAAPYVLVRTSTGWESPALPGERPVPIAVAATTDGFVVGGSAAGAPALWTSPDALTWSLRQVGGPTGTIQALGASGSEIMAIGTNQRVHVAFAGADNRTVVPLPTEDPGEAAFALVAKGDGWIAVGQDVDVGDVVHGITWSGDGDGQRWTLNERVAADRLNDAVIVGGRPFGVGSLERGGKLTPVLIPL